MSKYKTIKSVAFGEYKDKGSKFLAFVFPIESADDVDVLIDNLRKEYSKARHWCYAWRLGLDKNSFRANDDGEPSGTAGKPILGQIDSAGVTNVLAVVVRYFGGTLLGTSGLIQAYRESTKIAFSTAEIIEKTVCDVYRFTFEYSQMSDVMNAFKKLDAGILRKNFEVQGEVDVLIPIDKIDAFLLEFKALVIKKTLEEAEQIDNLEGIEWLCIGQY